jgi:hypothetical protein
MHHNRNWPKIRGLSKKSQTLLFPGKTSDGRLANLISGGGNLHAHALFVVALPSVSFSPRQLVCEVL